MQFRKDDGDFFYCGIKYGTAGETGLPGAAGKIAGHIPRKEPFFSLGKYSKMSAFRNKCFPAFAPDDFREDGRIP